MDQIFLEGGFIHRFVEWIINYGGFWFMLLIVFAETGLFIGFFFPGDSLLFAAGIYMDTLAREVFKLEGSEGVTAVHWIPIISMVMLASILGNIVGYWFGKKTGPVLFEKRDTWLFKKKHVIKAKNFYDKYGKGMIFLAKFIPIIRTFAPIVAGVVRMKWGHFMFYNITGSIAWVCSMMLGGYFLDSWVKREFGFSLKEYIEPITIGIILVTTLPVLFKILFSKKDKIIDTPPNP